MPPPDAMTALRKTIRWLVGFILGLPLLQSLLTWTAALLRAMADEAAGAAVARLGLACGVAWLVCLLALVVCLGLKASLEPTIATEAPGEIDMENV
jgi:hypothetical protein